VLTISPNLSQPDDAYALILSAHDGLSETESAMLNARLILILTNHIGDVAVLAEALRLSRDPAAASALAATSISDGATTRPRL
jgi:hypothetical protein